MGTTHASYSTGSVTSTDGTTLGYRQLGAGPGAVLLHGGMMTSQNFMKLGVALSRDFTVYLPDRRGRGMSGPYGDDYSLQRAAEDVQTLLDHTGAHNIFGLSAGAIPILQWALTSPPGYNIALYEPPLPVNGTSPAAWLPRYDREMAQGKRAAAMVTIAKGTKDSRVISILPPIVVIPLMTLALRAEAKQVSGDDVPLNDLIPTMHHDARHVLDAEGLIQASTAASADILLLGGSRSPRYLKDALDALQASLPQAQRVELRGMGHHAADNGGRPERVAEALASFFTSKRS